MENNPSIIHMRIFIEVDKVFFIFFYLPFISSMRSYLGIFPNSLKAVFDYFFFFFFTFLHLFTLNDERIRKITRQDSREIHPILKCYQKYRFTVHKLFSLRSQILI